MGIHKALGMLSSMLNDAGQVRQKLRQEGEKTRHLAAQAFSLFKVAPIEFPSGRKHFSGQYSTFYTTSQENIGYYMEPRAGPSARAV